MQSKAWKFCPECGKELSETFKYCPECGEAVLHEARGQRQVIWSENATTAGFNQ